MSVIAIVQQIFHFMSIKFHFLFRFNSCVYARSIVRLTKRVLIYFFKIKLSTCYINIYFFKDIFHILAKKKHLIYSIKCFNFGLQINNLSVLCNIKNSLL